MNIVVDQIIAVLQILPFGDAVGGDQNINLLCTAWHQYVPPLGDGREAGQHIVQGSFQSLDGGASVNTSGYDRRVQTVLLFDISGYLVIQILRRIGKRREDQHLLVTHVDGSTHFFVQ